MNQPYKKEYDGNGVVINPITKENPYLNKFSSSRGNSSKQYTIITHPVSGEFMGRVKLHGNNRKNTCKRRGRNSRNHAF